MAFFLVTEKKKEACKLLAASMQREGWNWISSSPVCLAYKPYFFSQRTVFFSHNKSANRTFSHGLSAKRTWHSIYFLPWVRLTMTRGGGGWGGTQKGRYKAGRQVSCLSQMQVLEKRYAPSPIWMLSTVPPLQPRDGNLRWHPPMVAGALTLLCQKWLCPCALCSVQLWLLAWRLCVGGGDVDEHGFQLALGWVGPDAWCLMPDATTRLGSEAEFSSVQFSTQDKIYLQRSSWSTTVACWFGLDLSVRSRECLLAKFFIRLYRG